MRKLLRQKARHQMERAGITNINRRKSGKSKFQMLWRKYAAMTAKKVSAKRGKRATA